MFSTWLEAMNDTDFRKTLGRRIKNLRKDKKLTQKELASALGMTHGLLNKYESGYNSPSLEFLIKLGAELGVSLDFVLTGRHPDRPLKNTKLLERVRALESFGEEDQNTVIKIIDALIIKQRAENILKPIEES